MNRRVWSGVLAGVLAATVLLGVAGVAYRAGQGSDAVVTRAVGDGEVVRVVDGYGWGHGPSGFFLLPLLLTVLVVFLLARAFRGGGSHGPCGPHHHHDRPGEPAEA